MREENTKKRSTFEERQQRRVERAMQPGAQVFQMQTDAMKNVAMIAEQIDRVWNKLLQSFSTPNGDMELVVQLQKEVVDVQAELNDIASRMFAHVVGTLRPAERKQRRFRYRPPHGFEDPRATQHEQDQDLPEDATRETRQSKAAA